MRVCKVQMKDALFFPLCKILKLAWFCVVLDMTSILELAGAGGPLTLSLSFPYPKVPPNGPQQMMKRFTFQQPQTERQTGNSFLRCLSILTELYQP